MEENKEYTVGLLMINTTLFVATTLAMAVMGGRTYTYSRQTGGSQLTGNRFEKQGTERKIAERITELRNRTDRTEKNPKETRLR